MHGTIEKRAIERNHSKCTPGFVAVAREFTRQNLSQLTVHHRDHNHDNNPSDGSNWELLCLYCHDNEHSRYTEVECGNTSTETGQSSATFNPFSGLGDMLKDKNKS